MRSRTGGGCRDPPGLKSDSKLGGTMFVRRRPLMRAAVVGGGAYIAGKRRAGRSAQEAGQEARMSDLESQQGGSATAAEPAVEDQSSLSDQLDQLSSLHEKGALTDAEFASAKSRLLGS